MFSRRGRGLGGGVWVEEASVRYWHEPLPPTSVRFAAQARKGRGRVLPSRHTTTVSAIDHAISTTSPTGRRRTPLPDGSFSTIGRPSSPWHRYRQRSPTKTASVTVARKRLWGAASEAGASAKRMRSGRVDRVTLAPIGGLAAAQPRSVPPAHSVTT